MTDEATPKTSADPQDQDDRTLRMSRLFAVPRESVFRAWTEPVQLAKWWGPEGCTASILELDFRPGGTWRTCILSLSGNENFVGGKYLEIDFPEKLIFTWAWETDEIPGHQTTITLDFHDRNGSTELVLTQTRFETAQASTEHGKGWSSSLNCLEQQFLKEKN